MYILSFIFVTLNKKMLTNGIFDHKSVQRLRQLAFIWGLNEFQREKYQFESG